MINPLDLSREIQEAQVELKPAIIIEETQQESNHIGYIDFVSLEMRGYTNWYYSSN